ncbi:hypothetical protein Naga_101601g1 [Nannochloropsis gaditana]|uniref:Uncharacterized protein n=1 Tax=Nannochloropsis gaditana TaxID=72520 RepID=W7TTR8_9STRA|nr:hypothetical protein Naga_101601g1 [Nannochloropsis gaditana]
MLCLNRNQIKCYVPERAATSSGFHHSQRFENEEGQDCVSSNITPFEAVKASEATGHFSSACDEMKVKLDITLENKVGCFDGRQSWDHSFGFRLSWGCKILKVLGKRDGYLSSAWQDVLKNLIFKRVRIEVMYKIVAFDLRRVFPGVRRHKMKKK